MCRTLYHKQPPQNPLVYKAGGPCFTLGETQVRMAEPRPPETWDPPQQPLQRGLPRLWPCKAQNSPPFSVSVTRITYDKGQNKNCHPHRLHSPTSCPLCSAAGAFPIVLVSTGSGLDPACFTFSAVDIC